MSGPLSLFQTHPRKRGIFRKGQQWCTAVADWSIVRRYLASVNFPRCSEAARDRLRAAGKHSRQISSRGSALKITDFSESMTLLARLEPRREPLEYEREIHRDVAIQPALGHHCRRRAGVMIPRVYVFAFSCRKKNHDRGSRWPLREIDDSARSSVQTSSLINHARFA